MSEPLHAPVAPEASGAAPVAPVSAPAPIQSAPPPAPPPPPAPAQGGLPPLSSQPPEVQALVNRGMGQMPGAVPANPVAAPTGIPTPPAQAGPTTSEVLGFFNEFNIPVQDVNAAKAAFGDVVALARQAEQLRQQNANYQRMLAQQQAPPAPAPQAPPPEDPRSKYWNVPQKDPQWDQLVSAGYVAKNERGLYAVTPEAASFLNPAVAEQMNRYETARKQALQSFLDNPYDKVLEANEAKYRELARQEFQSIQKEFQQQQFEQHRQSLIAEYETRNAPWMYAQDPISGQPVFTREGSFVANRATEYIKRGLQDPSMALNLAERDLRDAIAAQSPPPQAPAPVAPPPAPVPQPFLVNAQKLAQAQSNPSAIPQPNSTAVTPPRMTWDGLKESLRSVARPHFAA